MKTKIMTLIGLSGLLLMSCSTQVKQEVTADKTPKLYLDVHDLGPGNVTFEAVADAHKKDLAAQSEFDVNFIKYWVDEKAGKVYCLANAPSEANLFKTHNKAHGLVPDDIMEVTEGLEAALSGKMLYLDVH